MFVDPWYISNHCFLSFALATMSNEHQSSVNCTLFSNLLAYTHCTFSNTKEFKMNITLRKANALQTAIQEHIKSIDIKTSVSMNEFQLPFDEISHARETLIANDKRRADLTATLYVIRAQVGDANSASGVSAQLAQAAYIDKRVAQLKTLVDSKASDSLDVVVGKLDKIRNDKGESRRSIYASDTVDTGVLDAAQIDQFKTDMQMLKKQKQTINDKVLELNIRTEITLSDSDVALLKQEQLI